MKPDLLSEIYPSSASWWDYSIHQCYTSVILLLYLSSMELFLKEHEDEFYKHNAMNTIFLLFNFSAK